METIGNRVRKRRLELKLTQSALGNLIGISAAAVSQIERGDTKNLKGDTLLGMARALRRSTEWLQTGRPPIGHHNLSRGPALEGRWVPVISRIPAGGPKVVVDAYAPGSGMEEIMLDAELSACVGAHTFGLIVEGDSMLPDFRPGDIVIIDPDRAPRPGSFVAAKLEREDAATLKKYRQRSPDEAGRPVFDLVPLNEDYPTITVHNGNRAAIMGVVVEHRRRFK